MACCGLQTPNDETHPLVLGTDDSNSRFVLLTIYILGYKAGTKVWVSGDEVQPLVDAGYLELV